MTLSLTRTGLTLGVAGLLSGFTAAALAQTEATPAPAAPTAPTPNAATPEANGQPGHRGGFAPAVLQGTVKSVDATTLTLSVPNGADQTSRQINITRAIFESASGQPTAALPLAPGDSVIVVLAPHGGPGRTGARWNHRDNNAANGAGGAKSDSATNGTASDPATPWALVIARNTASAAPVGAAGTAPTAASPGPTENGAPGGANGAAPGTDPTGNGAAPGATGTGTTGNGTNGTAPTP